MTRTAAESLVTQQELSWGEDTYLSGEVQILAYDRVAGSSTVTAEVRNTYVSVQLGLVGAQLSFRSFCDAHQHESSCHHIAALLLELTDDVSDGFVVSDESSAGSSPGSYDTTPKWRTALEQLLPRPVHEPEIQMEQLGLLVKVEKNSYRGRGSFSIQVRPARRGKRSPWVQTGVSWSDLSYDQRFPEDQRQAVRELDRLSDRHQSAMYNYSWNEEWVGISMLPARELTEIMDRIQASGVAVVNAAASRRPIQMATSPARGFLELTSTAEGLEVAGEIHGPNGNEGALIPFGNPPVLVLAADGPVEHAENITLARFDPPITAELLSLLDQGTIQIPHAQVPDFEKQFLARLRSVAPLCSSDGSYQIPEPARPVLQLELDSVESPLKVAYKWAYSDNGPRQREVERTIIQSIENKLGGGQPLGKVANGMFPTQKLDRNQSIEFVLHTLPLLREHPDVQIRELSTVPDYKMNTGHTQVSVGVGESKNDWFDLDISVTVNERKVPFVELFSALNAHETYLVLENHEVLRIDGPEFQQLRQLISEAGELAQSHSDGVRMHKLNVDWWQELVDLGIIEAQENEWLRTMSQLTGGDQLEKVVLPESFKADLRDYQDHGLSWLNFLRTHSLGGVLADDMGLGKTVQLLACLETARQENPEQRFLVIAPTSVMGNWANEAARFTPEMRTVTLTQTGKKTGVPIAQTVADAQLVITSYTIFRLEAESFEELGFSVMIMDEAQMLKNHVSKGYKQARQMPVPCKFVVTGTPMENNLLELWALVSLAAPGLLGGLKAFKDNYLKPISTGDNAKLQRLKSRLRPFVLRRTKGQVATDLPAKTEQVLQVELEPAHRKVYDRRFARVRQEILGLVDDVDSNRFKILQSLTLLRQLALDPSLVDEGDAPSAKLLLLRELLSDAVAEGHRVLVFSQFTGFLGKARDVAVGLGIDNGYLDGSTSAKNRKDLIDGFTAGAFPVFFISLKSGGFGINLTSADYCILLDPWWNPAAEAQAIDRTHRIGQTKPVYVYRLVAQDTIESKVLALQAKKTQLFNDVLGEDTELTKNGSLDAQEFLSLVQ